MSIIKVDPSLTIEDCAHVADLVEHYLTENLGYDSASFVKMTIDNYSVDVFFDLKDDFQENLSYDEAIHHGWTGFNLYPDSEFLTNPKLMDLNQFSEHLWALIKKVPSREMRELQVTIKQLNHMSHALKDIKHEQAKQFVEDIVNQANDLTHTLEHHKIAW